ncbi:mechanosensitive ion channel family protein, partial [Vibrio sp. V34_P3A8T189]|nr:mechanosensitive ion channel family protein [Vibrio sp. V34_P3A8T189]
MQHLYVAIAFLQENKLILTLLIIFLIMALKRLVLSQIRGEVSFLT